MRAPLQRRMLARFASATAITLSLGFASTTALGQPFCSGPDGLAAAGACCQIVAPNLPNFVPFTIPGLGICNLNCAVSATNQLSVAVSTPALITCQEYVSLLTVTDSGSGSVMMSGKLHLTYTRTWDEISPSGQPYQVWRFAAKADLSAVAGSPPVCPLPRCLPPFNNQPTAFFYGYVDYASLCGTIISQNALVLVHQCDFFIHKPGFSSRPGVFHPNENYAIVAPHSTTQPFIPSFNQVSQGPGFLGGTREVVNLPGGACFSTNPLNSSQLSNLGGACLCIPAAFPKQHRFRSFQGSLQCPNSAGTPSYFQAITVSFPTLPWFNMVTTNVGRWAGAAVYPGQEHAWVDEGLFIQDEGCSGQWVAIHYGGSTRNGWQIANPVLINGSTDLADNYTAPIGGPYGFPILGNIMNTDRVIFVDGP
jgi:hypothetical protein